jgi:hypothetical protein
MKSKALLYIFTFWLLSLAAIGQTPAVGNTPAPNASVNVNQIGGANQSGADVVDSANHAFKVNCIVGCSATPSFLDNSSFTQSVSAIANIGGVFNDALSALASGSAAGVRITANRAFHVNIRNSSGVELGTSSNPFRVDPTGNTTQPVNVLNFPGTQPVSLTSVPLPTGAATSAKQPAPGTAGTPSADVITVQGATAGTPVKTDGSGVVQPVSASSLPLPSGAATAAKQPAPGTAGTPSADVITIQGASSGTAVKTDGSGVVQPVSASSLPLPSGAATSAKQPAPGTAGTPSADVITIQGASSGTAVKTDGSGVVQPVSASSLPLPTGAATAANQSTVKAASTAAVSTDTSTVVQLSPNQPQLTVPLNVYGHPVNATGCYVINNRTGTYSALSAGAILFSMRWTSSTSVAIIQRVKVNVITSTAATTAGEAERELHIVRSFTASDTGGTAVTLTGNNAKLKTSFPTSAVGDMRFGQPLTAGTGTADANAVSSVVAWLPLNFTGVDIGCGGASATGAVWSCAGGVGAVDLLNATNGQEWPIVLAQNEGIRITIGKDAMPSSAVQQTTGTIEWCEAPSFN